MKKSACVQTKDEKNALRIISGFDRLLQDKTFQNMKKNNSVIHVRTNRYGDRCVVQLQFKTAGCRMKKAGSCWNCNYGVMEKCLITPQKYIRELKKNLKTLNGDVLVLESLGSITDPKEFNQEVLKKVIVETIANDNFDNILIETHLTQIPEDLVEFISKTNNGKKQIGFELGIEDMNPEHRKLINKVGVQNNKLKDVYDMLQKYKIGLGINLIYGFPFMSESERIKAVVDSVEVIQKEMPNAEIVMFLMSIKENTIMEYLHQKGIYHLPNPWGFVESTKQILDNKENKNIITFSWFGEKEDPYISEQTCYTCKFCRERIINAFRDINSNFNTENRKNILDNLIKSGEESDCGCYLRFKNNLEKNDGKNPKKRYQEFIRIVNDKNIGEREL